MGLCVAGRYHVSGVPRTLPGGMLLARADDRVLRRPVLLKLVTGISAEPDRAARLPLRETDSRVAALFAEARLLSRHAHPAVARVYDLGISGGIAYTVQQWVDGPTIAEYRATHGALPPAVAAAVAQRLCAAPTALIAGLQAEHVVLAQDSRPTVVAAPRSPGDDTVPCLRDEAAVRAVATLLYELLTGARSAAPIAPGPPTPPHLLRPAVPRVLSAIVVRALAPSAAGGFTDLAGLGLALAPFAGSAASGLRRCPMPAAARATGKARSPSPPSGTVQHSGGRIGRARAVLGASSLLCAILVLSVMVGGWSARRQPLPSRPLPAVQSQAAVFSAVLTVPLHQHAPAVSHVAAGRQR